MFKKLLNEYFPKKWVIVNLDRGGFVGQMYNLVPFKRTITKSQNRYGIKVYYPWKRFPKEYFSHWKHFPFKGTFDEWDSNDLMLLNAYRFKWVAKRHAKQLLEKCDQLSILGIGEIRYKQYLSYSSPVPYYVTHIRDIVLSEHHVQYYVQYYEGDMRIDYSTTRERGIPFAPPGTSMTKPNVPLNYWDKSEAATKFLNKILNNDNLIVSVTRSIIYRSKRYCRY